jgi:hypothetical protein
MPTTVYVWWPAEDVTAGSSVTARPGHVAVQAGGTYMSYWTAEDGKDGQSLAWSYAEDVERCHRDADRCIVINRLAEGQMKSLWDKYERTSFRDMNGNGCTAAINVLAVGATQSAPGNQLRAAGLAILSPVRSLKVALDHDFREFVMSGPHDPGQVEEFAGQLSYLF